MNKTLVSVQEVPNASQIVKIVEQVVSGIKSSEEIFGQLNKLGEACLEQNGDSQKCVMEVYKQVLDILGEKLHDGGLSEKEREKIIACIVAMPDKAAAKDTENKEFLAKRDAEHQGAGRDALKAVGGFLLLLGGLLGGYAAYRSFRDDRRNARELELNPDLEIIPD